MDILICHLLAGILFAEAIEWLNRKFRKAKPIGLLDYIAQVVAWPFFLGVFVRGYFISAKK